MKKKMINRPIYKRLFNVTETDAKEIIKAGYPSFFHNNNWKIRNDSELLKEPCMCLYSNTKAYDFTFYEDSITITSTTDEEIFTNIWDDTNFSIHIDCYIKAVELGYFVPKLSTFTKHQLDQAIKEMDKKILQELSDAFAYTTNDQVELRNFLENRISYYETQVAPKLNEVKCN